MENPKLNYYKESGIAAPLNICLVMLCSLLIMLFFSYLYSLIISFIPIVYLNFIVVVIYGFTVSFTSRAFNVIFKIRNQKKSILITLFIALFAVYFQWVSFLFIISNENFGIFTVFGQLPYFLNILFRPDLIILDMIEISKVGLWSLGFSEINVTGPLLWLFWLAEAVIIVFVAFKSFISFEVIPFSEKDNTWFRKEWIDFDFEHIAFKNKFIEQFAANPAVSILELKRGDGIRHSKINISKSKTESKCLIAIDNIVVTQRGKGKKDVTKVLKHCYIDNLHLSRLRKNYRFKKASIFDY